MIWTLRGGWTASKVVRIAFPEADMHVLQRSLYTLRWIDRSYIMSI